MILRLYTHRSFDDWAYVMMNMTPYTIPLLRNAAINDMPLVIQARIAKLITKSAQVGRLFPLVMIKCSRTCVPSRAAKSLQEEAREGTMRRGAARAG